MGRTYLDDFVYPLHKEDLSQTRGIGEEEKKRYLALHVFQGGRIVNLR